ncbi:hypothetical protein HK099_006830 [Clydaea vesicula]|uniref:EF-hand domain-containing protein n=1 Tax=Clydaea vesicula TaxID=447962 RepID=A0AAD5TXZ0_9FUNG|nr:hypothetical protein HK099_006830 [Clydaea vesicula]
MSYLITGLVKFVYVIFNSQNVRKVDSFSTRSTNGKDSLKPNYISTEAASGPEISFATILGFASKKMAKGTAFIVGLGFIGFQTLAHAVIKINWPRVEGVFMRRLDQNNDGKVDSGDVKLLGTRFLHNMTNDLPCTVGFTAGK